MTAPIDRYIPRTGRTLRENGETFNVADYMHFQQRYNVAYEIINNGPATFSYRELARDAGSPTITFGIEVPANRRLILFDRILKLNNGTYEVDLLDGDFTGGTAMLEAPLNRENSSTVTSTFFADVTEVGTPTLLEVGLTNAGENQGARRSPGVTGDPDFFRVLGTGPHLLRVNRVDGTGEFDILLKWLAWEEDAPA